MAQNAKPASRLGLPGCLIIVLLGVSAFVAVMALTIAPASMRLAAPIICEAGSSSVVTHETWSDGHGRSSSDSCLYCVDARGRAFPQSSFRVWLAMVVEALVAIVGLAVLLRMYGFVRAKLAGGAA